MRSYLILVVCALMYAVLVVGMVVSMLHADGFTTILG